MHAWLTLFYAGQNLLNHLTAAFHPVHARLTHSILRRTEFVEPFDSAAFHPVHARLTHSIYAGQNLLNDLTTAFHPVHACLTHSILCRTEFAEPFDSAAFLPLAASLLLRLWRELGTVWVFLSCLWVFLSCLWGFLSCLWGFPSGLQHYLTILLAYCHDGEIVIITL